MRFGTLLGRRWGSPSNLLGGATRTQIRVYANGWGGGDSLEKLTDAAQGVVARGFTALKFDPFPNPWRAYISRRDEEMAVEHVAAVPEAVGPDVEILVEVHRRLAPMHAVRVARRMEPYRPFWYEEPVSSRDMAGLAEARRRLARAAAAEGDFEQARDYFLESLAIRERLGPPQLVCEPLAGLALVSLKMGALDEAVRFVEHVWPHIEQPRRLAGGDRRAPNSCRSARRALCVAAATGM